jgi:hypothetical protein
MPEAPLGHFTCCSQQAQPDLPEIITGMFCMKALVSRVTFFSLQLTHNFQEEKELTKRYL